jgi:tRNA(adenine34) deaminase
LAECVPVSASTAAGAVLAETESVALAHPRDHTGAGRELLPQGATEEDLAFMREALAAAREAERLGEVPVGCVIVVDGTIVARAHNLREQTQDPTAHAELIAIRTAAAKLGSWRLDRATAYVTLEPCPMCAGALVNARVARVVYGADDPKAGATRTLYAIGSDPRLNHRFALVGGVLMAECGELMSDFFGRIRAARRAARDTRISKPSGPARHAG